MKTRTSTLKNLVRQFRNTKKSTKADGTKQRTSFTPDMESLETRALLTTMPGLTIEPTADAAVQVANNIENQDALTDTSDMEAIAKGQQNDAAYIKFDGIMAGTDTSDMEAIAKSQKNDAAYIKFDGIMAGTDTSDMEAIAKSQKNDAAYIKFDGIMAGTDTSD
ncbi:MAG: hypothetical protein GY917_27940, partial [Planctomycetaceae bacterium]|nr:hypothetical protein [Planctomycetaceae bacterium]